jgi:hypothetical protein
MYGLAVVTMADILEQRLARELYLYGTARTLNRDSHAALIVVDCKPLAVSRSFSPNKTRVILKGLMRVS